MTANEWSKLESVVQILRPFYQATKLLSYKKYPSLSSCFVVYKNLRTFLGFQNELEDEFSKIFKTCLLERLNYHLSDKLTVEQVKIIKVIQFCLNFNKFFLILLNHF